MTRASNATDARVGEGLDDPARPVVVGCGVVVDERHDVPPRRLTATIARAGEPGSVFAQVRETGDRRRVLLYELTARWGGGRVDHDHLDRVVDDGERVETAP